MPYYQTRTAVLGGLLLALSAAASDPDPEQPRTAPKAGHHGACIYFPTTGQTCQILSEAKCVIKPYSRWEGRGTQCLLDPYKPA